MILQYKKIESEEPRTVELPIHPAVSFENWVGLASIAMIDNHLTPEQESDLLDHLRQDPEAVRIYAQVLKNEIMLSSYFAEARLAESRSNEPAEALASPIW